MTAAETFDILFRALPRSSTLRQIWRTVYGADYPEDADPFSFVTLTDLRRMAGELRVGPELTLADLACGRGGPGLWMARATGASLIGVDFSKVAVEQAQERARQLGMGKRCRFRVADAAATGLPGGTLDAVMSVDSLWLFPDKRKVATEVARILRPGGRFAFTSWEFDMTPSGWPPQLGDHRDMLRAAGFLVDTYEETPDWRRRQISVYEAIVNAKTDLEAELGEAAASDLITEARETPAFLSAGRRVLIAAHLP